MENYIVTLTSPSHSMVYEPQFFTKAYKVKAKNLNEASEYVDEKLMRDFALEFKVAVSDVRILFAAKVKK
jgi:hypothetical protein